MEEISKNWKDNWEAGVQEEVKEAARQELLARIGFTRENAKPA